MLKTRRSTLCQFLLLTLWWSGKSHAGYDAVQVQGNNVLYNQTSNSGGVRMFPNRTDTAEAEFEYFFSELNFNDVTGSLLTGAADTLYLLDKDLSLKDSYSWETDPSTFASCATMNDNPLYSCRNHIRVYKRFPSNGSLLLVCGTQGNSAQQCRTLEIGDSSFGVASPIVTPPNGFLSPYPEYPGFGEFVDRDSSDERFFSGGFPVSGNQFSLSYFNVSNTLQVDRDFSNDVNNDRWLNYPGTLVDYYRANYPPIGQAVNEYDYQFYFVFMRESIVDDTFDIVYSRVVRICRNDPGSTAGNYFTTYMKARIFCGREVPPGRQFTGTTDYQYNEISSVVFNDDGRYSENTGWSKLMYGAFTGPTIGPSGTAICVYQANNDPFASQAGFNRGIFEIFREDLLAPDGNEFENLFVECDPNGRSDTNAQRVQVVQVVSQIGDNPLLVLDGLTVTQMVIDPDRVCVVRRNGGGTTCVNQDVLFLGTDTGKVIKVVFATNGAGNTEPIIAEEITLDGPEGVNTLSIEEGDDQTKYLYVSTFSNIYRLPLERCSRHQTCGDCIGSRDPYCVWNTASLACERNNITTTDNTVGTVDPSLIQNIHNPDSVIASVCNFPTIEFASSSYTVNEDTPVVTVTITSSVAGVAGLVELYTLDGTATGGSDYVATTQTVNFDPGQNQTTIDIALIMDMIYEGSEFELFTVGLRMTGVGGVNIGDIGVTMVTINENDVVMVAFESADLTVSEGNGYINITLIKTGDTTVDTTVLFSTMDNGALGGQDYLSTQQTVTFDPSETRYTVIVLLLSDRVLETNESFVGVVGLIPGASDGVQIGAVGMTTVTITDDDYVRVEFSSRDYTVIEGTDSCVGLIVEMTGEAEDGLEFVLQVTPATGTAGSSDFDPTPRSVRLNSSLIESRVCIPILNDSTYENSESFTVELTAVEVLSYFSDGVMLSSPVSLGTQGRVVVGGNSVTTVTITDDDSLSVEFQLSSATVNEGDGGIDLVVVLQGDSDVSVDVLLSTLNQGGSTPVSDYSVLSDQLIKINQSEQSSTHRLYIVDDRTVEGNEEVRVQLSLPQTDVQPRVSIGGRDMFSVTIQDDDTVSVRLEQLLPVTESAGYISVTLFKYGFNDVPVSVILNTTSGTATAATDYAPLSNSVVVFSPDDLWKTLNVSINDDNILEMSESFTITAETLPLAHLTAMDNIDTVTATITDDDAVTVGFAESSVTVNESDGSVSLMISLTGSSDVPVSVTINTLGGSAQVSSDFLPVSQSVKFMPGQTQQTVIVQLVNNDSLEDEEYFSLELSLDSPGVTLGRDRVTVTIMDEDNVQVFFQTTSLTVSESDGWVDLVVLRQGDSDIDISVQMTAVSGSALALVDFSMATTCQSLLITSLVNSSSCRVSIIDDSVLEDREEFRVQLTTNAQTAGVIIGTPTANVTIVDNDAVTVGFAESSVTVDESDGSVSLMISLTGSSDVPVSVTINTVGGSAQVSSDFLPVSQSVKFMPGQTQQTVMVQLVNNDSLEDEEYFSLELSLDSPGVTLGRDRVTITIMDEDNVQVFFQTTSLTVSESDGWVDLVVLRQGDSDIDISVQMTAVSGSALALVDFSMATTCQSLLITSLVNSSSCRVSIIDDSVLEDSEEFRVQLTTNAQTAGVIIGTPTANVTIVDNDFVIFGLSSVNVTVSESDCFATVTIIKNGLSDVPLSLLVSTSSNTSTPALPGQDYVPLNMSVVTFSQCDSYQTISIDIVDNLVVDGPRSFEIVLERVVGRMNDSVRIDGGVTTVFVEDNDVQTTPCPTEPPPTSFTNIVNENTTPTPIIPGNVNALGNIYSSVVDSGVVLAFLLFVIAILVVVILVLVVLLCRRLRTEKLIKQSLADTVHPSSEKYKDNRDRSGMALPGLSMQNKFYRENSSLSAMSLLHSPSPLTPQNGTPALGETPDSDLPLKENLSVISEETDVTITINEGHETKSGSENSLISEQTNSPDDIEASTAL